MDIPDSDEYVEATDEEEMISIFHDEIRINHHKILDEDGLGSYRFGFFINDMENVSILHVVLSGNQLTREEKIMILLMRDEINGNLLLHILNTFESELLDEELHDFIDYYESIIRNILYINESSFVTENNDGESPFFTLVKKGEIYENITKEVLMRFSEMNRINDLLSIQDVEGNTLLHILLNKVRNELIRFILDRFVGNFLYIRNNDGDTPLMKCCRNLNIEIGNLLLDKGVRITQGDEGNTPLHVLLSYNYNHLHLHLNFVERLLRAELHGEITQSSQNHGARNILDVKNDDGETPVIENLDVIRRPDLLSLFLKYGLNVNDQVPLNGENLLFRFIKRGIFDCFKLLMYVETLEVNLHHLLENGEVVSPFKLCMEMITRNVRDDSGHPDEENESYTYIRMYALLLKRGFPDDLQTFNNEQKIYHGNIYLMVRATILQDVISKKLAEHKSKQFRNPILNLIDRVKKSEFLDTVIHIAKEINQMYSTNIDYNMQDINDIKRRIIEELKNISSKDYADDTLTTLFEGPIEYYLLKNIENPENFLHIFNKLFRNLGRCINGNFTVEQKVYIRLLDTGIELQDEDEVSDRYIKTKNSVIREEALRSQQERTSWRRSRAMAGSRSGGSKKSKKRTRKKLKKSHKKLKKTNKRSKRISKRNNKKKL